MEVNNFFMYFIFLRNGILGKTTHTKLTINGKEIADFFIDHRFSKIFKQYCKDISVKTGTNKYSIFRKFHSKLPIETKSEFMTGEVKGLFSRRHCNMAETRLRTRSLPKYVIIPNILSHLSI